MPGDRPARAADPRVNDAAKRGIFAYIVDGNPGEMQSAIDITLRRYAEYRSLEGAFARRAVIERAKGIMMARQSIDERKAFELLRAQSQRSGRKLFDVAEAVVGATCCSCRALAVLACEGLRDCVPVGRHHLQLRRRLLERDIHDRVAVQRRHAAEPPLVDQIGAFRP